MSGFSVYERGGKWWASWSEVGKDGKRYTERKTLKLDVNHTSQDDAERVASERYAGTLATRDDKKTGKSSVTLAHAVEDFLTSLDDTRAPKGTRHMYKQKCDRLLGRWHAKAGSRRVKTPASLPVTLAELTPKNVDEYFKAREKELLARSSTRAACGECDGCNGDGVCERRVNSARSTLHKEWVALSRVLKRAGFDRSQLKPEWVSPPPIEDARERWLAPEEFTKLLNVCPPNVAAMVAFMIATGARRAEAFRFKLDDLDRKTWLLTLRVSKTKKKSGKSRVFIVPEGLRPLLTTYVHGALDASLMLDAHKIIALYSALAKIPTASCNDLRRTFGSLLVQGGTPLDVVARLMGHANTNMVFRVYGKHVPSTLAAQTHVQAFTLSTASRA